VLIGLKGPKDLPAWRHNLAPAHMVLPSSRNLELVDFEEVEIQET